MPWVGSRSRKDPEQLVELRSASWQESKEKAYTAREIYTPA